jgi:NADH:ubiquinone oxidoreductase subunit K
MTLPACLVLSSGLFCVGLYGLLTRRHAIGILLSTI